MSLPPTWEIFINKDTWIHKMRFACPIKEGSYVSMYLPYFCASLCFNLSLADQRNFETELDNHGPHDFFFCSALRTVSSHKFL